MNTGVIQGIEHIIKTPGIVGGRARIDGRRISVELVVLLYDRQNTPVSEIANMYELTAAQVHAALAYYYDNREEIDVEIAETERLEAIMANASKQKRIDGRLLVDLLNTDPNREMTTAEVSQRYGITDATVRQTIKRKAVKARKSGSIWLIRADEVYRQWGHRLEKRG